MKTLIQFISVFVIALLTITSCTKEDVNVVDVENYTNEAMFEIDKESNTGHKGCFEFVWPLEIVFPDETTAEFEDYQSLREGIKRWKEANPDVDGRPQLSFPLEIMGPNGGVYTIESKAQLKHIVKRCIKAYWDNCNPRHHFNRECFRVVLPVNIKFPSGQIIEFETRIGLKSALRAWKAENPDAEEHPELAFPVNVLIKETGEKVEIATVADLRRLKETCSGD